MRKKVIVAVLASAVGWGFGGVGTRAAYELGANTLIVLTVRSLVASLAVGAFVLAGRRWPSPLAWRHGSMIGILRIGLAPMLFMGSLNFLSAGVEGLVITLVPATTAVLAAVVIKERVSAPQVVGLVIGLTGTALIAVTGQSGLGEGGNVPRGFALAGVAVLVGSMSGVLQRKFAPLHETAELALPMFLSGLALAGAAGMIFRFGPLADYPKTVWVLLVMLGLGSTLMPFVLTLYASKHTSATIVATTGYLAPLVGVVGGVVLLGEEVTAVIVIGAVLAMIGVALVGGVRRTPT